MDQNEVPPASLLSDKEVDRCLDGFFFDMQLLMQHQLVIDDGQSKVREEVPVVKPVDDHKESANAMIVIASSRYRKAKRYTFCCEEGPEPVVTVSKLAVDRHRRLSKRVREAYEKAPLEKDVVVRLGCSRACLIKAMAYLEEHKRDRTLPLEPRLSAFDEEFLVELREGGYHTYSLWYEMTSFAKALDLVGLRLLVIRTRGYYRVQRTLEFQLYDQKRS